MSAFRIARVSAAVPAGLLLALAHAHADGPALRGAEPAGESDAAVASAPSGDWEYRFGPGDKLRITVYGEDDLSGAFEIDRTGFVRLPLIGDLKASGLDARELEAQIEGALDAGYLKDARVAVEVIQYRPIYVIGEVNKPGQYPYVSNMNGLNAIALAGGFTEKAVESTVYVRHEGETKDQAVAVGRLARVYPGDVVRVEETAFWSVADLLAPLTGISYVAVAARP